MNGQMLKRRGVLAALAGIAPASTHAQTILTPAPDPAQTPQTPAPHTTTPQTITLPAPQVVAPAVPPLSPPKLSGPAAPIDATKAYYLFFDQTIDVNSMHALRR